MHINRIMNKQNYSIYILSTITKLCKYLDLFFYESKDIHSEFITLKITKCS